MTLDDGDSKTARIVILALLGNIVISLCKFTGALISNSSGIFAEAVHSLVDSINQIFLLLGIKLGNRPPDAEHPFGYGKEKFFWAFIVAISMFLIGSILSIQRGVSKLLHPVSLHDIGFNYFVLGISTLMEGYTCFLAYRELKRSTEETSIPRIIKESKKPSIIIVFLEDTAALIGITFAFLGLFLSSIFNNSVFDAVASILIGILLAVVAVIISWETKSLLIGEGVTSRNYKKIERTIASIPEVKEVLEILTMYLGPNDLLVAINVNFSDSLSTDQLEGVIDIIEKKIRNILPEAKQIFVEAESCKNEEKPSLSHELELKRARMRNLQRKISKY